VCTSTRCVAVAAALADNNQQIPAGGADVLQFSDGHWQDTPALELSITCSPGAGAHYNQTISWSLEPQPDGTLHGVQTVTILDGNCGPHDAAQGDVYRTPFVLTRTGDVPPSVILADPALFMP
jgi:serine/threonine-protein kinase